MKLTLLAGLALSAAALLIGAGAAAAGQASPPAAPPGEAPDPLDFNASVAEYNGATAGETFAHALGEVCPQVLDGRIDLDGDPSALAASGLARVAGTPSFLRAYPQTRWFSLAAAPRNVFLSIDAAPGQPRCRVAFANNLMVGAAHLWADGLLRSRGATLVRAERDARRNLNVSIRMLRRGEDALLFLVQTVPQPERGGRGWQGDATAAGVTRERAQALGIPF